MKRWLAIPILFLAGCGGSGKLPTYEVTGKVRFGETPAAGALVVFHRAEKLPEGVSNPRATVGADGTFKLTTYQSGDGAPEGDYKVTVSWMGRDRDDNPVQSLHPRYGDATQSGIGAKVGKGPTTIDDIVLKP